jgi:SAM-dependent methyltransferase
MQVQQTIGSSGYTLGSSTSERARLREQAGDLLPHSKELFAAVGVKPGWRALDLGCGPVGNLGLLAELTGAGGSVLGMDVNPENLVLASESARSEGWDTVSVRLGDAPRDRAGDVVIRPRSREAAAHQRALAGRSDRGDDASGEAGWLGDRRGGRRHSRLLPAA